MPHGASTRVPCAAGSPSAPGGFVGGRQASDLSKLSHIPRACDWQSPGHIPLQVGPALARPHPGLAKPPAPLLRTSASISPVFALGRLGEVRDGFLSLGSCGRSGGEGCGWRSLAEPTAPALPLSGLSFAGRDGPNSGQASPCTSEQSPSPQSPQNSSSGKYTADPKHVASLKVPAVCLGLGSLGRMGQQGGEHQGTCETAAPLTRVTGEESHRRGCCPLVLRDSWMAVTLS